MGRGIWPREGILRVDAFSQWQASRGGLNHVGSGPMSWLECRPLMRTKCSVQQPNRPPARDTTRPGRQLPPPDARRGADEGAGREGRPSA